MKIGRKLLIYNIVINIIAMITLSLITSAIVSNYVKESKSNDLLKANKRMVELFKYDKFFIKNGKLVVDKIYEYNNEIIYGIFVIEEETTSILYNNKITDEQLTVIEKQEIDKVYNMNLYGMKYLGFNSIVSINFEGRETRILITSLIPNLLIQKVIYSIIIALVISITIISLISIIITSYMGKRFTKPIEKLKNITEKIANQDFDVRADIKTNDELESLANSINQMAEKLNQHEIEQKKFYENISHELKTPVTVISGYAEGLKTNIFDDNEKALDTIIKESAELKKQIEDIIFLNKLDTVKEFYIFNKVNINSVISEAINRVESIVILKDIDIIYNPIGDLPLNIDKNKILRMIVNILSNCIKYTKDTIEIKTVISNHYYKIIITDNGDGFSETLLNNPFSRTIIGEKEGTGIGLSIIKKVVDGHNGRISLHNKTEGGAKYIIELPLK